MEPVSKEKEKRIRKLLRGYMWRTSLNSLKYTALLLFANMLLILVDHFYVKNEMFRFFGALTNAFFIFPALFKANKKEHDRFREDSLKILAE